MRYIYHYGFYRLKLSPSELRGELEVRACELADEYNLPPHELILSEHPYHLTHFLIHEWCLRDQ